MLKGGHISFPYKYVTFFLQIYRLMVVQIEAAEAAKKDALKAKKISDKTKRDKNKSNSGSKNRREGRR